MFVAKWPRPTMHVSERKSHSRLRGFSSLPVQTSREIALFKYLFHGASPRGRPQASPHVWPRGMSSLDPRPSGGLFFSSGIAWSGLENATRRDVILPPNTCLIVSSVGELFGMWHVCFGSQELIILLVGYGNGPQASLVALIDMYWGQPHDIVGGSWYGHVV